MLLSLICSVVLFWFEDGVCMYPLQTARCFSYLSSPYETDGLRGQSAGERGSVAQGACETRRKTHCLIFVYVFCWDRMRGCAGNSVLSCVRESCISCPRKVRSGGPRKSRAHCRGHWSEAGEKKSPTDRADRWMDTPHEDLARTVEHTAFPFVACTLPAPLCWQHMSICQSRYCGASSSFGLG